MTQSVSSLLEAAEKAIEGVTPGPWYSNEGGAMVEAEEACKDFGKADAAQCPFEDCDRENSAHRYIVADMMQDYERGDDADAKFVAAARELVPRLAQELRKNFAAGFEVSARCEVQEVRIAELEAQLAELHGLAERHNPRKPSPETAAMFRAKHAETLARIGPEKAMDNVLRALEPHVHDEDDRAKVEALWGQWDDERDPHAKAKIQMQLGGTRGTDRVAELHNQELRATTACLGKRALALLVRLEFGRDGWCPDCHTESAKTRDHADSCELGAILAELRKMEETT